MAKHTAPNEVSATAKYVRVAPRKARMVVDQIRNASVEKAFEILAFSELLFIGFCHVHHLLCLCK